MKAAVASLPLFALLCASAQAAPIVFEAEHANGIDAVFLIDEVRECSGGLCLTVPDDAAEPAGLTITGAKKNYVVNAEREGPYDAWFRVYWEHACANSFWLSVNAATQQKVTDTVYSRWHWLKGPAVRLKKGGNVLALSNREDGAFIDQIAFASRGELAAPPAGTLKPTVIPADPEGPAYNVFFQLPVRQRFVWDGRTSESSGELGSKVNLRGKPAGREVFIAPGLHADMAVWIRSNTLEEKTLTVMMNVPKHVAVQRPDADGKPFTVSVARGTPLSKIALRVSCTDTLPRDTRAMRIHLLEDSKVVASESVHVTRPFDWALCGPLPAEAPGQPDTSGVDTKAPWAGPVGGRAWVRPGPAEYLGPGGSVDVLRVLGKGTHTSALACTRVSAAKDGEYELLVENDDQIVVWMDGNILYRNKKEGPAGRSRTLVKTALTKGTHTILLRIFQTERHWEFKVAPVTPGITGQPFSRW